MGHPSICVVMSTYNGEKYVAQQMDSILAQDVDADLQVRVRDDGSSDGTLAVLRRYETNPKVSIIAGKNLGYVDSFFECLSSAPSCDYYAFSDQDDIWLPNKLSRALEKLVNTSYNGPLLYASELQYCDEYCKKATKSHLNQIGVNAQDMLYEVICSGNTQVFNKELAQLACSHGWSGVFAHDWWFALVASFFGKVVFDEQTEILYRRLNENTSPSGMSGIRLMRYRIKKILGGGKLKGIHDQLEFFYNSFGPELSSSQAKIIRNAVDGSNVSRAFAPGRYRQKPIDEVMVRMLLLLGKL